jgi:hypothetical protein
VLGFGVKVALDAVINESNEACCNDDTEVVRWEDVWLDE